MGSVASTHYITDLAWLCSKHPVIDFSEIIHKADEKDSYDDPFADLDELKSTTSKILENHRIKAEASAGQ